MLFAGALGYYARHDVIRSYTCNSVVLPRIWVISGDKVDLLHAAVLLHDFTKVHKVIDLMKLADKRVGQCQFGCESDPVSKQSLENRETRKEDELSAEEKGERRETAYSIAKASLSLFNDNSAFVLSLLLDGSSLPCLELVVQLLCSTDVAVCFGCKRSLCWLGKATCVV